MENFVIKIFEIQEILRNKAGFIDSCGEVFKKIAGDSKDIKLSLLTKNEFGELEIKVYHGFEEDFIFNFFLEKGKGIAGKVYETQMPVFINLNQENELKKNKEEYYGGSLISIPITSKNKSIGVFQCNFLKNENFSQEEIEFLTIVSNLIADSYILHHSQSDNIELLISVISSLAASIDAKDPYTAGHTERVAIYSLGILTQVEMNEYYKDKKIDRDKLRLAAFLHDIGKIATPDRILQKPEKLTDDEFAKMKEHSKVSFDIVSKVKGLEEIAVIVKAHHERWDGKGYPDGLESSKIPLEARILAVADTVDAMTTDRPYRKGLTLAEAKKEVEKFAAVQFDPIIAKAFVKAVADGFIR